MVVGTGGALWAPTAEACAVCACGDPTLTSMGAEQPFAGRRRVAVELGSRSDAIGEEGVDRVLLRDDTWTTSLAWSPADRWQLAASMPVGRRTVEDVSLARTTVWSPGDLTLRGRWVGVRAMSARHWLAGLGGGARVPTAPVIRAPDGTVLPMSAQFGVGHPTGILGAWAFTSKGAWSSYASSEAWVPVLAVQREEFESQPGLSGRATVAAQWQPRNRVALRGSFESRLDAVATLDGEPEPDTGGGVVFSRADLIVSPKTDIVVQAGVSVPTIQRLRGFHVEGPSLALGVTHDF
jgi:hypothetical protein